MPNKACKFRLYPTPAQKILLAKTFGCVRLVYNHWLDRKIKRYKEDQTTLRYTFCAKELAVLKKTEEYAFLKEVDSISLQQSLRHLDQAFQNFFNQLKKRISTIQIQKKQKEQLFDRLRQSEHPPVRRLFETAEDRTGQGEAASRDS